MSDELLQMRQPRRHRRLIANELVEPRSPRRRAVRDQIRDRQRRNRRIIGNADERQQLGECSNLSFDGVLNEAEEPIAASGAPTAQAGLYFIGFVHSLRGNLFEANLASRRLARNVRDFLGR